jgi:uncharacterized protein YoxC
MTILQRISHEMNKNNLMKVNNPKIAKPLVFLIGLGFILTLFILGNNVSSTGNIVGGFNVTVNVSCVLWPTIQIAGINDFYERNNTLVVYANIFDGENNPVDNWTYLNMSIKYQHNFILNSTPMIRNRTGFYFLNYTIAPDATYGTYVVVVEGDPCGEYIQAITSYQVGISITGIVSNIDSTVNESNVIVKAINSKVDTIDSRVTTIHSIVSLTNTVVNEINSTTLFINSTIRYVNTTLHYVNTTVQYLNVTIEGMNSTLHIVNKTIHYVNDTIGSVRDLAGIINTTVNYINEVKWGNFSYTQPIPTVLILQGKIKRLSTEEYLSVGSLQVNISDAYLLDVVWSHQYDNVIKNETFNLMLGGTYDLSLIPKRKYRRDVTVCDGITFDPNLYLCETFTVYFIA